ncbi:hypothetical protein EXIGUO8H_80006 [Exiguobacterium sp. 8H]|uniref:hypothetical protein n=1 Tax=unclassified Exiguobacterium TaxID=2644629 RepID=UPI0012F323BC|nr:MULTISPECIES: hypothetical protein [unclassified Exiguobacterium]VXB98110.1 hypothetical protein EXIGUO8A_440003 [Exiguobacterium sp. 8A]VXC14161.1 hypothetical protein EXIGUO8H_80006 [Exiguobacterium sp. 8H]
MNDWTIQGQPPAQEMPGTPWFTDDDIPAAKKKAAGSRFVSSSMRRYLNIIATDDEGNLVQPDGGVVRLLSFVGDDIRHAHPEVEEQAMYAFAILLRSYRYPLKVVTMNFPVNTAAQRASIERRLKHADGPRREALEQEWRTLERLDRTRHHREYFFLLFAPDAEEMRQRIRSLRQSIGVHFRPIDPDKQVRLVRQLHNGAETAYDHENHEGGER